MVDRKALRLSAWLVLSGLIVSIGAGAIHPGHERPNDHAAAFAEYAASSSWTAVHLGQFVGMAFLLAGLLALAWALGVDTGMLGLVNRFAQVAAVVSLALYGALQAVDGVALKAAVDAWTDAPASEQAGRFAAAEAIRWLEWAMRSYQSLTFGVALILLGAVILASASIPRPIGAIMGLSGLAYVMGGWILGVQGFSDANTLPTLAGYIFVFAWAIWLAIHALRAKTNADVSG